MSETGFHRAAFRRVVEEVARAIAVAHHEPDGSYVRTPVLYPGDSMVVVRIDQHGKNRYLVSDMGLGRQEADLMGAPFVFSRVAPVVAEHANVGFDHRGFFVQEVGREQLAGAVATIAACSQEAVQVTAFKLAEKKTADAANRLYARLAKVFTPARVARNADIIGASNTTWHVATLVTVDGGKAIYEPVASNPSAIAATVTKFFDIAQLDHAPARIAVVRSKQEMGTRLNVIAGTAKVVEEDVSDQTLVRLARAA
jgi:hypothetical protein